MDSQIDIKEMLPECEEIWKDIPEYEGLYQISNLGRVKSFPGKCRKSNSEPIILSNRIGRSNPYYQVILYKGKSGKSFRVHRLVAQAFIPNPDNKPCIDHIDTNTKNNRIENLRWATHKENANNPITRKNISVSNSGENNYFYGKKLSIEHREKMSLAKTGKLNGNRSIPVVQICSETGIFIKEFPSAKEAERELHISEPNIISVCKKKRPVAGGYVWAYKSEYEMSRNKDEYIAPEKFKSLFRPVAQIDLDGNTVEIHNSIKHAAELTGTCKSAISRCAKSGRGTSGGYRWIYLEKQ